MASAEPMIALPVAAVDALDDSLMLLDIRASPSEIPKSSSLFSSLKYLALNTFYSQ